MTVNQGVVTGTATTLFFLVSVLRVRKCADPDRAVKKRKAAKRWQVIAWGEPTSVSEAGGTPGIRYAFKTPSRRRFGGDAAKSPPGIPGFA